MKKLLKTTVCLLLAVGMLTGCAQNDNDDPNVVTTYDVEETADVVIVGGGGTGMSAALTAVENGAESVIIIEKLPVLGGFMRMKPGQFSAPDTTIQREQGLTEDSAEKYEQEILKFANLNGGHPIEYLVHSYASHAQEAWEWVYEMGVKDYPFMTDAEGNKAITNPGHMPYEYDRTYVPLPKKDSKIANPIIEVFEEAINAEDKIKVFTSVEGRKLIPNDKGQILGVEALGVDGKTYKFNSTHGVVMSTGGYAANPKLFELYSTDLHNLLSAALSSDDGYGLKMMQEVGAGITEEAMYWIETYPKGYPNPGSTTAGTNISTGTYYTGGILVNKEGNRFVDECAWDDEVRNAGLKAQPDSIMFEVFTDKILEDSKGTLRGSYDYFKEGGSHRDLLVQADSLEELADKLGLPQEAFLATVATYNEAVENGSGDPFGREFTPNPGKNRVEAVNKLEGDHYYALQLQPIVLSSRGGITVNELNQVIDEDGNVIPGLYAGGEVVGQMWGKTIAPGVGMNGAVTWGHIIGANIMNLELTEGYEVHPANLVFDEELFIFDEPEETPTTDIDFDNLVDGEYEGVGTGMGGELKVKVTVADGKIASVEILEHNESPTISDPAIEQIPSAIVEANSTHVDAVTNATVTSDAIMQAVENALQ